MDRKWYELSPGMILLYEEAFLQALASTLPEGARVINIGGFVGTSSSAIMRGLAHLEEAHVLSIDIEKCPQEIATLEQQGIYDPDRFIQWVGSSESAIISLAGGPEFDMVFVDGSHAEEDVYNDLVNYGEHLKPGGLLIAHDYKDPRQEGVTAAVNRWRRSDGREWKKVGHILSMVVFWKPGGDLDWANGRLENLFGEDHGTASSDDIVSDEEGGGEGTPAAEDDSGHQETPEV